MGRRLKFLLQWTLCAAVLLLAFLGSKGSVLFLSRKLSKPLNKLSFARRAVLLGIDLAPSPAIASILPPNQVRASSPAKHMNTQTAPPPSPANHMITQIAPPPSPATRCSGPVTNSPSALPPVFEDAPPCIHSSVQPIQNISPSSGANVEHKQPRATDPSVESQAPNIHIGAVHELSPSAMILPPLGQHGSHNSGVRVEAPNTNVSVTSPLAPDSSPPEKNQSTPNMQPISAAVPPSMILPPLGQHGSHNSGVRVEAPNTNVSVTSPLAPDSSPPEKNQSTPANMQPISAAVPPSMTRRSSHTRNSDSPATSPMVNTSHNFLAAPPKGTTGDNSSAHHSRIIGLSPASSPLPHEAKKSSGGSQSPSLPSSQPPRTEEHHNHAPAPISPINRGTASRRAQQHMLAPSSPAPFSSHPQTPAENITQNPAPAPTVPIHDGGVHKGVGNQSLAPSPFPVHEGEVHKVGNTSLSPSPSPIHKEDGHKGERNPSLAPSPSPSSEGGVQKGVGNRPLAPTPSSSSSNNLGPAISPSPSHHVEIFPMGPSPSPLQAPVSSGEIHGSSAPSPSPMAMAPHGWRPKRSPAPSPSNSSPPKPMTPRPQPVRGLPPPPPNLDCTKLTCTEPLTYSPPGSPCACVSPIKVELRLSVALYTFFPLVSELAQEIAYGIFMKQSQVRIMGANAASEEPDKTIVLIDLVPLGDAFDYNTALLTYTRFWHKQVVIKSSYFGDYDVLYVIYPGLPPSPPIAPASINVADGSFPNNNNARAIKPLGVDVRKQKHGLSGSSVAIIVLSSVIALVLCGGAACLLLLKCKDRNRPRGPTPQTFLPSFDNKSAGMGPTVYGSRPSSASGSFGSSIATYTGSAKTFSLAEIERATNQFNDSRIIGEGGFGRVYQGTLEDGIWVAVKVLKRDDQQGGREFLAEVEMLSRLHHRNLVKLIGICTEEHLRCLVYELIPNGSVESHLHGVDKDSAPLDWNARMKIALGAARGLAYLHEDSSPRVIHRDFKSSNILLEHDFTPKVSDFGLARTALEEGNEHISTRVMGTFGYVAPEYAMTGHLLVKSDVYSYGVVLLELLTGRKPVDMSQPPGQENLVTWARPLLTSKEGLEIIIDPALATEAPFDSLAKVAAIASMCVQPEVSHRPFMGEVVQALKLVCNEGDEHGGSGSCSQEVLSAYEKELGVGAGFSLEAERGLSACEMFSATARFTREGSGSFRRHSSSGPLRPSRSRTSLWDRVRGLSAGSLSDHAVAIRHVTGQWH